MTRLEKLLIKHEGYQNKAYEDTVGTVSIGVGRNLDDVGLSDEEIMYLLNNDIIRCDKELINCFPWYSRLSRVRQEVMLMLCFNLGLTRLRKFVKALSCMESGEFSLAADHFLDSKWAKQVGNRAVELTEMLITNRYLTE
jgi:lysozyme